MNQPPQPEKQTRRADDQPATGLNDSHPTNFTPNEDGTGPALPEQFGRYRLLRRLGAGGMGSVFLAHEPELDRRVALKVPRFDTGETSIGRERFLREARAAATLQHPNVCPVYEIGVISGIPYLTMAFIDGRPLNRWVEELPGRPVAPIAQVLISLARALDEAHRQGLVHRDLKPSNVMVDRRGEPILLDFGLAHRQQTGEARLSVFGSPMGTPAYMPPEQVRGDLNAIGPASDVYSLGVVLFELLTDRLPFLGSPQVVMGAILHQQPPAPTSIRKDLDPAWDGVVLRALAKDPAERWHTMGDLASQLMPFLGPITLRDTPAPCTPMEPTGIPPVNADRADEVLAMFRANGWTLGKSRLRARVHQSRDPVYRAVWQNVIDTITGENRDEAGSLNDLVAFPGLLGWALAGRSSSRVRDGDFDTVNRYLDRAEREGDPTDSALQAMIAQLRGDSLQRQGRFSDALPYLHDALQRFGSDHPAVGRVLDAFAMAYAGRGHFHVAQEFFEHALQQKQRHGDEAGMAVTHGRLGRLFLEWCRFDEAEEHFQANLVLAQKGASWRNAAQTSNRLGQLALARGDREAAHSRKGAAKRHNADAVGWLDEAIRLATDGHFPVPEGFARKDRAVLHLRQGEPEAADEQIRLATECFQRINHPSGVAHLERVAGEVRRFTADFAESQRLLRSALARFDANNEAAEAARCQHELARTLRAAGSPLPLVTHAFRDALYRAESARHAVLVRQIEEEFREVDPEAYLEHMYRRVRGAGADDTPSLGEGDAETLTVLDAGLPGFAAFAAGRDPEAVLMTINHLQTDFAEALTRHDGRVLAYAGGGMTAVFRGARHAERAVRAAVALAAALGEFNAPRELLGLPLLRLRVGVESGHAISGNVGTWRLLDAAVLGEPVERARLLTLFGSDGRPALGPGAWELVRTRLGLTATERTATTPDGELTLWELAADTPIRSVSTWG